MFIFLDESGNFMGKGADYFIIGGFVTGDHKRTAKAFRKWQHTKFPKKLRYKTEVKFCDSGIKKGLRLKTLEYFTRQDIRIFFTFLDKKNIPLEYQKKKRIKSGFLYTEIVAQTLLLLLPTPDSEFRIFRDKRHLKSISEKEFHEILKIGLLLNNLKATIQIEALDSTSSPNIQIADWICGALFQYYNQKEDGLRYFSILKNSIITSKEIFEDYWINLYKNKKSPCKS